MCLLIDATAGAMLPFSKKNIGAYNYLCTHAILFHKKYRDIYGNLFSHIFNILKYFF
jgi:hypothetical protein